MSKMLFQLLYPSQIRLIRAVPIGL